MNIFNDYIFEISLFHRSKCTIECAIRLTLISKSAQARCASKSKALFIILSILLVGGGTLGCFAAAVVFSGTAIGVGSASVEEGACLVNGTQYPDGANVPSDNACELCQCLSGDVICPVQECPPAIAPAGCTALPVPEDKCCPDYSCPEGRYIGEHS